jgi:hypothetical protein
VASRALIALLVGACALAVPAIAESPVTVSPEVGPPATAFRVSAPASYRIRQPAKDRYWFVVHGPGGRQCETSVTDRVGIAPAGRPRRVAVDLPGVRVVNRKEIVPGDWCEGIFRGHVEFRDWRPQLKRYVVKQIGTFSWTVQASE